MKSPQTVLLRIEDGRPREYRPMRRSSLVAATLAILALGCSDATNPVAPQFDADQTPQPSASAVAAAPSLVAVTAALAPDPADRILLDTRTSLRRATSLWSAKAAFGPNISA